MCKNPGNFLGIAQKGSVHYTFYYSHDMLTPCSRATQVCVIAIPCVVDSSRISLFSYTTSCTCVCQLVWLTYPLKVIITLLQDAWVSSYKQTDRFWPALFRTIRALAHTPAKPDPGLTPVPDAV